MDKKDDSAVDCGTFKPTSAEDQLELIASMIGHNELAKKATSLGEKIYHRLVRDFIIEKLRGLGVTVNATSESDTVLAVPFGGVTIELLESDIELMREAIAKWDAAHPKEG